MRMSIGEFPPAADPAFFNVADVMTREVVSVRADNGVDTVAELLLDRGFSGVPVVDRDNRLLGMLSKTDLVRESAEEYAREEEEGSALPHGVHLIKARTVREVMSPGAQTVKASARLAEAAAIMAAGHFHRLPVVDDNGKLVGLITSFDIVRWVAEFS